LEIQTIGLNKKKSKLAIEATKFFADRLMSKRLASVISIDIDLDIKASENENELENSAECTWNDDNLRPREFTISLSRKILNDEDEFLLSLAHEMVHIKQMARGELKELFRGGYRRVWNKKNYGSEYRLDNPWEVEAYSLQSTLVEEFLAHK